MQDDKAIHNARELVQPIIVLPTASTGGMVCPLPEPKNTEESNIVVDYTIEHIIFWKIVASFQWHNASVGPINQQHVCEIYSGLTASERRLFHNIYMKYTELLLNKLHTNGVFEHNHITEHSLKIDIISHIIALGHHAFHLCYASSAVVQHCISEMEYQSFQLIYSQLTK